MKIILGNWKKFYDSANIAVHATALGTFGRRGVYKGDVGIGPTILGLGEASSHAAQSLNIIMLTYLECIKGPMQIAKILKADKVLTTRAHYAKQKGKTLPDNPYS